MKRLVVLAALLASACSSGDPILFADFRGPVAAAVFQGVNPAEPALGLVPLIAVASFRGDELRIIDPVNDQPIAGPNLAYPLGVPTMARPTYLASGSLNDPEPQADLLVVASSGSEVQLLGTWLDGSAGFGVVQTVNLEPLVGVGAQILDLQVAQIPSGPPVGTPPVAPPTPGKAWVVMAFSDPQNLARGSLVFLTATRQGEAIALADPATALVVPLDFTPVSVAAAPDHVRFYMASQDPVGPGGVYGIAELDTGAVLDPAAWTVRAFPARGSPTTAVAAAFVGERIQANFYTFSAPALRVYAVLAPSGCGPERPIACGVATFDPETGGLAAEVAVPGPAPWNVPVQSYRMPLLAPSLPIAMGIATPAANPGPNAPSTAFGSQVCYSPAAPGVALPLCPSVTEEAATPPFNATGAPQPFMLTAPQTGQLWTSEVGLVTAVDGLAYVQDLGRFGPVNAVSMLNDDATQTQAYNAVPVGPAGPFANSAFFGFPEGTTALGLWLGTSVAVSNTDLIQAVTVWPGYTRDDHWLVSYQGLLPGLAQRRSVLGLAPSGDALYLAIQESAVVAPGGVLPADSYWVPGAIVASPDIGIHALARDGAPGDLGLFLLDQDPCPSTRPNWIPSGGTAPSYDPTKPPLAHEAVVADFLPPDPALYPGGGLLLAPAADSAMASEYQCLLEWFQQPGNAGIVLTAFNNNPPSNDYARGGWVRAGGLLLVGAATGYAGRPAMDVRYDFAWAEEDGLSGESLVLARKARRFYYPAAYPNRIYGGFPGLTNAMQTGPALSFRVGRYCVSGVTGCDATTSPPARDAGIDFSTQAGFLAMSRYPGSTAGGNFVTTFDKSTIPGQEYRGRVFYVTYTGDLVMMIPPGLDVGQSLSIR
ncbi:MAG TPA: hypothetical protein PLL32_04475 [Anaeromyxobacteraceae bacterium]|nr:hypothetical protein [Anaeromyxobacteraceae bacterium]